MQTRLFITALALITSAGVVACADPIIQGHVFQIDKKTPIDKVSVEIYSAINGGQVILLDSTKTDSTGYYKFDNLKAVDSYDIVYSNSQYDNAVVTRLAENGEQKIRKYLYRKGQKVASVTDLQDKIFATKRMAMLAVLVDEPGESIKEFTREIKTTEMVSVETFNKDMGEITSKLSSTKAKAATELIRLELGGLRGYLNAIQK